MAAFPKNGEQNRPAVEDIGRKVLQGGLWMFALRISSRGIGFIRTLILARLLSPEDFGLLGIAMLTVGTLETFSHTGFQTALIQKQGNTEPYLDTAWTVSLFRGFFLFLILYLSAPWISSFFESADATEVIRVVSLSVLISGGINVGVVYFQKELLFQKQMIYDFSVVLADLAISVPLAFYWKNVWALVIGGLGSNIVRLLLSHILHPYRPKFRISWLHARQLFRYGKWVTGSSIILIFINRGDDIIVGKLLGAYTLGLYQMAYMLSNLPTTEVTHVISQVTLPAYSKAQDQLNDLKRLYLKVLRINSLFSVFFSGMLILYGKDLIRWFLGERWLDIVPAMILLTLCGAIRSIGATIGPVVYAKGRPALLTKLTSIKFIVLAVLIYPLTVSYGMTGAAISLLVATMISNPIADYYLMEILNCSFSAFVKPIFFAFLSTGITAFLLMGIKYLFPIQGILSLSFFLVLSPFVFLGIIFILSPVFNYQRKDFFMLGSAKEENCL